MKIRTFLTAIGIMLFMSSAFSLGQKAGRRYDLAVWQNAVVSLREGKREEALQLFKNALGDKPDRGMVEQAGRLFRQSDAIQEAEAIYQWGRSTLKEKDLFAYELGELYQMQLKYREAVREYALAYKKQPPRVMGKFDEISLQAGYLPVAKLAEAVVDRDSDDGKWLVGELFRKAGDIPRAWHYQKKIADPKRLQAAVNQLTAGPGARVKTSIDIIEEYLNNKRFDEIFWKMKLSDILLDNSQYDRAEKILEDLAGRNLPPAKLRLAELWLKYKKAPEKARALIEGQSRTWPDSLRTEAEFAFSLCLAAQDSFGRAMEVCQDMTKEQRPASIRQRAYLMLGEMNLAGNKMDQALENYGQAVRTDEEGRYANDALVMILLISQAKTDKISILTMLADAVASKYGRDASKIWKKFSALADSAAGTMAGDMALWELSDEYGFQGQLSESAGALKRLTESASDSLTSARAYYRLGQLYNRMGQEKNGLECWKAGIMRHPNTSWAEMMRQEMETTQGR
jgi:tetratricopeptide (TPR) repeat protein